MTTPIILLTILAAALAVGLALWQYYLGKRRPKWWLFVLLRFLTYFSILLLLINPEFKQEHYTTEKPSLVLAVDNSRSISAFEQEDEVRKLVEELSTHKRLNDKFNIEAYSFGQEFKQIDTLDFSEGQTNISSVFINLKKLYKTQTAPTVLVTDGNQTIGADYEFQAENYGDDVYPVVVGDTAKYADLKIDQININRYAFLENEFPVEVFVNYEGDASISKKFSIKEDDKIIHSETLKFDQDKRSAIVHVELPAEKAGVQTYEAEIAALDNEKNTDNNTQNFAIEVIDQRTDVLILSAMPHPDLGTIKKSIAQDQHRKTTIKYIGEDIDFGAYQLIVLYQPNDEFEKVLGQVETLDLNFLMVTGTKTNYDFLNQHQDFFKKEETGEEEYFLPVYNSSYSNFQFEDLGFDDFPPLQDEFGNLKLLTDYQVLLYQSVDGFENNLPLLATLEQNERRYGLLFGENIWQWRSKSFRDNERFEEFDDFLGKLIQYLSSDKKKERLTLDFESFYNSGEDIVLRAHYFDANYEFDPRAKLSAEVKNVTSGEEQNLPLLLKKNRYEVNLSNLEPGEYEFTMAVEGKNLSESGAFSIIDFDVEQQFLNADVAKLNRITEQDLNFLDTDKQLIEELLKEDKYKPVQKGETTTAPLIEWWYLLLVIAVALSIEWCLRKYKGLI